MSSESEVEEKKSSSVHESQRESLNEFRRIRQEQDEAYSVSLKIDQLKVITIMKALHSDKLFFFFRAGRKEEERSRMHFVQFLALGSYNPFK